MVFHYDWLDIDAMLMTLKQFYKNTESGFTFTFDEEAIQQP